MAVKVLEMAVEWLQKGHGWARIGTKWDNSPRFTMKLGSQGFVLDQQGKFAWWGWGLTYNSRCRITDNVYIQLKSNDKTTLEVKNMTEQLQK